MLSSKSEEGANNGSAIEHRENTRRASMVYKRNGIKAALNIPIRAPKPQSLPSYLVKVLLSLVQARLEAKVGMRCTLILCSSTKLSWCYSSWS